MENDTPVGTEKKFIIRLVGLQPGASRETLVQALQRLFKGKSAEEIGKALDRLPLVLSRSVPEDKARQIKLFLEAQGAILKITYSASAIMAPPKERRRPEIVPARETPKAVESAPAGVERRAKPRVHAGIQVQPHGGRRNPGPVISTPSPVLLALLHHYLHSPGGLLCCQLRSAVSHLRRYDTGFFTVHGSGVRHFRFSGRAHIPGAAILGSGGAHPRGVGNVSGSQHLDQSLLRSHAEPAWSADRHSDPVVHHGVWCPCFVWDRRSRGRTEPRHDGARRSHRGDHCSGCCDPCHMDFHNPVSELASGRQSRGAGGDRRG